jgi:serine/threonine protein phosphatase 1
MLEQIFTSIASQEIADWRIVLVGDYVDRGPDCPGVIERLMKEEDYHGKEKFVCLMGNHDQCWANGETFLSEHTTDYQYRNLNEQWDKDLKKKHIEWIKGLRTYFQDDHRIYVHAGLAPDVPLEEQSPDNLMWIRGVEKIWHGKTVVHGHTPHSWSGPLIHRNMAGHLTSINVDTGCCFGRDLTAAIFADEKYMGFLRVASAHNSNDFLHPPTIHENDG